MCNDRCEAACSTHGCALSRFFDSLPLNLELLEARAASKVQIEGENPTVVITGGAWAHSRAPLGQGLPPQKLLPPNATVTSIPPLAPRLAPDAIHPRLGRFRGWRQPGGP